MSDISDLLNAYVKTHPRAVKKAKEEEEKK